MFAREPGFGPAPQPWWGLFGGAMMLGMATLNGSDGGYLWLPLLFGVLGLCWGGYELGLAFIEWRASRASAAPVPRAALTERVLRELRVSPEDLAANQRGEVTPAQLARLKREVAGALPSGELGPPQVAEGEVGFIVNTRGPKQVRVGGVKFVAARRSFLTSFKRGTAYRVYYLRLGVGAWLASGRYNILLAAEALEDG